MEWLVALCHHPRSPTDSPDKGPITRALVTLVSLMLAFKTNGWTNRRVIGDLRCHDTYMQGPINVRNHSFPRKLWRLTPESNFAVNYPMMTSSNGKISALLAICAGNSPVPGEFPTQRPVTRRFGVFFELRPNKRLRKQSWGWWFETLSRPLWRHCNAIEKLKHL